MFGIDVSSEMIQFARKLHNHPKVTFMQFDIAQEAENILEDLHTKLENNNVELVNNNGKIKMIPIDSAKEKKPLGYDLISSFYCLHWIPNQRCVLTPAMSLSNVFLPGIAEELISVTD